MLLLRSPVSFGVSIHIPVVVISDHTGRDTINLSRSVRVKFGQRL